MRRLLRVAVDYWQIPVATVLCASGIILNNWLSPSNNIGTAGFAAVDTFSPAPLHLESRSGERPSVVIAIQYGCIHCERSMPFFRRLLSLEESHGIPGHVVFVAPDEKETIREMVGSGIRDDHLASEVPLSELGITGTPTLLAVDRDGRVSHAWIGEITGASENAVLKALQN
jgi:hypothetical protein